MDAPLMVIRSEVDCRRNCVDEGEQQHEIISVVGAVHDNLRVRLHEYSWQLASDSVSHLPREVAKRNLVPDKRQWMGYMIPDPDRLKQTWLV